MSHLEVGEAEERWVGGLQEFDIERRWLVKEKEGEGFGLVQRDRFEYYSFDMKRVSLAITAQFTSSLTVIHN